jgi:hypothetical protein
MLIVSKKFEGASSRASNLRAQLSRASRNPALGRIDPGFDWRPPYQPGTAHSEHSDRRPAKFSELQSTCVDLRRWNNLRCFFSPSKFDCRDEIGVWFCFDVLARNTVTSHTEMRNLVMTRIGMPLYFNEGHTNINIMLEKIAMAMALQRSRVLTYKSLLF